MPVKVEKIDPQNPDLRLLKRAASMITSGKVIVCPTDTGYAFAANALNIPAIHRVFILKGRAYSNPMHIAVHSLQAADRYAKVNKTAELLARRYLPGALTLVLPRREIIPPLLTAGKNTIGIRIPNNKIVLEIARLTNLPITATSANVSGKPGTYSIEELREQMGDDYDAALVLDQGALPVREVSTIVDLTGDTPQLIRQGKISWLELHEFIQSITEKA